jgi:hypothetical protein
MLHLFLCNIFSLSGLETCELTPGTKTKLRIAPLKDLNGTYPRTVAEIKIENSETPLPGDTMRLGEPFDFSGAPVDEGFWREFDIVVDSGNMLASLQGDPGAGQSWSNTLPFYLAGTNAERLEFASLLSSCCEGFAAMIPDKNDVHYTIGEPGLPVFVQSAELSLGQTTGDRKGGEYTLVQSAGQPFKIYDAATHGIDVEPNTV